jgi:hypothetical protein
MPIDGVLIEIRLSGALVATLTTDVNGHADTTLQAGSYDVTLTKAGFLTTNYTLLIVSAQTHATFDLQRPSMQALALEAPFTDSATAGVVATYSTGAVAVEATMSEVGVGQLVSAFATAVPPSSSTESSLTDVGAAAVNTTTWSLKIYLMSIDGANPLGTLSPGASATPAAGATQAINLTETQYWAFVKWIGNEGIGEQTTQAYTIAAKTAGKQVIVFCLVSYGWQLSVAGSTADETDQVAAGTSSKTYTKRATGGGGEIWDGWYLDNVYQNMNTTYTVGAQTSGTNHTLTARFHYP